jgi:hypothetical protein
MRKRSDRYHKYHSAHHRFLKPSIMEFFKREFPSYFGPAIREKIADELIVVFEGLNRNKKTLKPGQILWNAIDKNTRADSPNRRFIPVILTIVNPNDIDLLVKGLSIRKYRQNVIARITREAFQQGALLSMRDIALLLATSDAYISKDRKEYEEKNGITLPHTGSLHDMGSCITHKYQIIYKIVVEKKDPFTVARETNHSQKAVDHYYKDFNRVKLLYFDNKPPEFIQAATGLPKYVINQYLLIINQYVKEPLVS